MYRTVARLFHPSANVGACAIIRVKIASAPTRSRPSMSAMPSRKSASISRSPERCHISQSALSGRAAAVRFASEGARVVVVDVAAAGLRQTVAAVEKVDGEAHAVEADVTKLA